MPVPDSQVRGALQCRFSLFNFCGTPLNAGVAQQARAWLTPIQCYNKIPWDAMKLNKASVVTPATYSLLTMSPVGCLVGALKKAEDRDEIILRVFNPSESVCCDTSFSFSREISRCAETGMDEEIQKGDRVVNGTAETLRPCQSRTFSIKLA